MAIKSKKPAVTNGGDQSGYHSKDVKSRYVDNGKTVYRGNPSLSSHADKTMVRTGAGILPRTGEGDFESAYRKATKKPRTGSFDKQKAANPNAGMGMKKTVQPLNDSWKTGSVNYQGTNGSLYKYEGGKGWSRNSGSGFKPTTSEEAYSVRPKKK